MSRTARKRDAQKSRRKIVLAARAEFAAKGYAGARMEQIADRAEVKKELIYHYFRGKEHLFEEVRAEQLADVEQCHEIPHNPLLDDFSFGRRDVCVALPQNAGRRRMGEASNLGSRADRGGAASQRGGPESDNQRCCRSRQRGAKARTHPCRPESSAFAARYFCACDLSARVFSNHSNDDRPLGFRQAVSVCLDFLFAKAWRARVIY